MRKEMNGPKPVLEVVEGKDKASNAETGEGTQKETYYRDLINEYIQFIEVQCRRAIGKKWDAGAGSETDIDSENESLELFNRVLDKLKEKNYRVLKQFKGQSKVSTYLTAIISNQAVDLIRRKKGRGREKERAMKYGPLGEKIYQAVFASGKDISTAYNELSSQGVFNGSLKEFHTIIEKIKGKGRLAVLDTNMDNPVVKEGKQSITTGELIIVDTHSNPEELMIQEGQEQKRKEILSQLLSNLKGEERLIIRMRFPTGRDEKPKEIEQIAELLGISKKAVYNRISRLLTRCRELLTQNGVQIDDLF